MMNAWAIRRHELRGQAADLALAGKHAQAARLYAELLQQTPEGEIALRLGEQRRRCGDLRGAMAALRQAITSFECEGRESQAEATRRMIGHLQPPHPSLSWLRRAFAWLRRSASAP
jgi:thioredoxin-like negative regulator of GroEL